MLNLHCSFQHNLYVHRYDVYRLLAVHIYRSIYLSIYLSQFVHLKNFSAPFCLLSLSLSLSLYLASLLLQPVHFLSVPFCPFCPFTLFLFTNLSILVSQPVHFLSVPFCPLSLSLSPSICLGLLVCSFSISLFHSFHYLSLSFSFIHLLSIYLSIYLLFC